MLVILLARGLSKQSLVILVLASRSYRTDNVQFVAQNMTFKHSLQRSNTFLISSQSYWVTLAVAPHRV